MFPFAIDEDRAAAGQTFAIYVEKIEPNVTIDPRHSRRPPRSESNGVSQGRK